MPFDSSVSFDSDNPFDPPQELHKVIKRRTLATPRANRKSTVCITGAACPPCGYVGYVFPDLYTTEGGDGKCGTLVPPTVSVFSCTIDDPEELRHCVPKWFIEKWLYWRNLECDTIFAGNETYRDDLCNGTNDSGNNPDLVTQPMICCFIDCFEDLIVRKGEDECFTDEDWEAYIEDNPECADATPFWNDLRSLWIVTAILMTQIKCMKNAGFNLTLYYQSLTNPHNPASFIAWKWFHTYGVPRGSKLTNEDCVTITLDDRCPPCPQAS